MHRLFILGCGFVGTRVAAEMIRRGWSVCGSTRSGARANELRAAGIEPLVASLDDQDRLTSAIGEAHAILVSVAAGRDGSYEDVYVKAAELVRNAATAAKPAAAAHIVYTSSTRVYEESNGDWVDENSPAAGSDENGKTLARAERIFLECSGPGRVVSVVRLGGIYGDERDLRPRVLAANEAPGDGNAWVNLIHIDDITRALAELFSQPCGGTLNVTDGQPVVRRRLYDEIRNAAGADPLRWAEAHGQPRGKRVRESRLFAIMNARKPASVWEHLNLQPPQSV